MHMEQPPGFQDPSRPSFGWRLKWALYGLRQAPKAWFDWFSTYILSLGFFCSSVDSSLFICHNSLGTLILLLYVDDIILTGSNPTFLDNFIQKLEAEFALKDLGFLHYFLGVEVRQFPRCIFLSQTKYASDLLVHAQMKDCRPISTPLMTKLQSTPQDESSFPDPHVYRSIVGGLQYLTFTRPNISYSVNYVCQFMHATTIFRFKLIKRILRYIQGTIYHGIRLLSKNPWVLYAFSDAN